MEKENDKTMNFFDLSILILGFRLLYDIFRKPTYFDNIIPSSSIYPDSIKHIFFFYILLSGEIFYINIIKSVESNNDYY